MQKITLSNIRMRDLYATFNDLTPQEIVKIKEEDGVKNVVCLESIISEFEKALEPFQNLVKDFQEKQQKLFKNNKSKLESEDEEIKQKAQESHQKEVDKLGKELKVEEEAKKEITVELSDSKHEYAQKVFDRLAMNRFKDLKACTQVAKALGIGEE